MSKPKPFAQPFQDYEIVERLGAGGMGVVFRARRKADGIDVALKVLHPSRSRNRRYLERLRREAEITMRLDHPHVVKGLGFGDEGGYHFLVMAFVEGKSLRELLRSWGRFPEGQVREIGKQLADALRCAHEHGIVHRDVKPGNVLVSDDGVAMLTDLGLAKAETDPTVTRDGATVGTPQYMSPEQAKDPASVDVRGDLYSLGATLYHMLVGAPPFEGDSVGQLVHRLMTEPLEPPSLLCEEVSPGFDLVLQKLLARDRELRYQNASELLADLNRLDAGEMPKVNARSLQKRARRWPQIARIAGGVLVGLLLVVAVLRFWPSAEPEPQERVAVRQIERQLLEMRKNEVFGFGARLSYLADVASEGRIPPAELARLRAEVTERFRLALAEDLEQRFGVREFELWLEQYGMADWRRGYLQGYIEHGLQQRFGLAPSSFPAPVREQLDSWRQLLEADLERSLTNRVRRLAERLRQSFEGSFRAGLEQVQSIGDYGEADRRLRALMEDPLASLLDTSGRTLQIAAEFEPLLDPYRTLVQAVRTSNRELAARTVERFEERILSEIHRTLEEARSDLVDGIAAAEERLARLESEQLAPDARPWRSLPDEVSFDRHEIDEALEAARRELRALATQRERAQLQDLTDALHDQLRARLDVGRARDMLERFEFDETAVREEAEHLRDELDALEAGLDWIHGVLAEGGRGDEAWFFRGRAHFGRVVRAQREDGHRLVLRLGAREEEELRLEELPAPDVLEKLRQRVPPATLTEHERQIGLYLLYRDRLDEAKNWLVRAGHGDAELRRRIERRRQRLETIERDAAAEIDRLVASVGRYLEAERTGPAAEILRSLRERFASQPAWNAAEPRVRELEAELARLRRLESLRERLDPQLRGAEVLQLLESEEGGLDVKLRIDAAAPVRFANGLGSWSARGGVFVPSPLTRDEEEQEPLRERLRLALPIFDDSQSTELALSILVPPAGPPLNVLAVDWHGARVLFVQDRERAGANVLALSKDLRGPLAPTLARGDAQQFVLRGQRRELRIRRGPLRLDGRREWSVQFDDQTLWRGELRETRDAPAELALHVAGGFGFEVLEVLGK